MGRRLRFLGRVARALLAALVLALAADLLMLNKGCAAVVAFPAEARADGLQRALG